MGSIMATSTFWEFGMNTRRMWCAMTVTAQWNRFMFVGMTFHAADSFMFGAGRQ